MYGNSSKKIWYEECRFRVVFDSLPMNISSIPIVVLAVVSIILNSLIIATFCKTKCKGNGARFTILAGEL